MDNSPIKDALGLILSEARRAARKHPPLNSAHEGYAVLLEEVDELKAEVWKRDRDIAAMRAEAVQVGAMALRFIIDVCDKKAK
jgi:molybdopterin biosynthesis enzyme